MTAAVLKNGLPGLNLSPRAKLEILFATLLALFLFALDQTVVGVALPRIVTDLHGERAVHVGDHHLPADLDDQRPHLRQAVRPLRPPADHPLRAQPVHRRLRSGRASARRCGSSSLFRGLQGLGGGAIFPVALAIARRPVHARRARQVRRLSSAPCSACRRSSGRPSAASSPTPVGWHWIFFVNVPIGLDLALRDLAPAADRSSNPYATRNIDYVGAALFTGAIAPFLIGLTNKTTSNWMDRSVGRRPDRSSGSIVRRRLPVLGARASRSRSSRSTCSASGRSRSR